MSEIAKTFRHPSGSKRRHPRLLVVEPAELRVAGHKSAFPCIIRNLSDGGAYLRVPVELPSDVDMELVAARIGIQRPVKVIWRDASSAGVSFR